MNCTREEEKLGLKMNSVRKRVIALLSFILLEFLIIAVIVRQTEVGMMSKPSVGSRSNNENGTQVSWLIIFWSTIFGVVPSWVEGSWKKGDCPVACELTVNHSRVNEASAFIVHARDAHMIPPTHSVPWILFTQENPVYTPVLNDSEFMSKFNLLRSYRLDSDIPNPVYAVPDLKPPVPFSEKTGLIFAAFSNCEPVRIEYMRQLMNFVPVDSYGGCLRNKNDLVLIYGKDFKLAKTELSRKYKFTLVFFNQDCDYFVDDQMTHALNAGSVPVVMGTDKVDEFLPDNLRNAVIKVRDFKSPRHLADYLLYLSGNETQYNSFLDWKWKGIGNVTGTTIGNYWQAHYPIECQMCVALSQGRIHKEGLQAIPCKRRAYEDWGIIAGA
ncbi:alpha-(1,3)-fucosyltransferase 10-like isoform X1 [Acropora muricata]|uniref:alpha-(1,3)-fucosyltransferase 10-like isoform X1 n=2 Tax=Acropora muricata TaxID=159855 RepID=UPI0034E38B99